MAERYAVANGNWSATSTWNGGTLPGAGDTVHANGFGVVVDQDVTVDEITTTAGSTAVAGGNFTVPLANRTITADIRAGSDNVLFLSSGSGSNVNIVGNVYGSDTDANSAVYFNSTSCNLTITGNVYGGEASNSNGIYHRANGTTSSVTIDGDVIANSVLNSGRGAFLYGPSTRQLDVTITGDVIGGGQYTVQVQYVTLEVQGNVVGSTVYPRGAIYSSHSDIDTLGDVSGGSNNSAPGIMAYNYTAVICHGSCTAGSGISSHGITCSSGNGETVFLRGDCIGDINSNCVRLNNYNLVIEPTATVIISNHSNSVFDLNTNSSIIVEDGVTFDDTVASTTSFNYVNSL